MKLIKLKTLNITENIQHVIAIVLVLAILLQFQSSTILASTPDFIIENLVISNQRIDKGSTFTVSFNIKNTSGGQLKDIYLDTTATSFSRANTGNNSFLTATIENGQSYGVSLSMICNDTTSNKIPITLKYVTAGNVEKTTEEQILVTFDTPVVAKEVDTAKYKPSFVLTSGDLGVVGAGSTTNLSLTIKNNSSYNACRVVVTPQLPDNLTGKISLNSGYLTPKNVAINNGAEQVFEWSMTVTDLSLSGSYPITYSVDYTNSYNDAFTSTVKGYIKVTPSKANSGVVVNSFSVLPEVPVRESKVSISFDMKNKISTTSGITIWIEGLSDTAFTYQDQVPQKKITLGSLGSSVVTFDYLVKKGAPEGNYPYTLKYTYTDANQNLITTQVNYILNIPPVKTLKGTLEIQNMSVPIGGVSYEKSFQVNFDLVNVGDNDIESIEVNFASTQEIWAQSQSIIQVKKLAKGEKKTLTYTLMGSKQTESKNVPITFSVSYDAKADEEVDLKSFNVSNGVLIIGANKKVLTAPKIIVSSFVTTPGDVSPGMTFDLGFKIRNTNLEKDIKNVKMTLSSVDQVNGKSNIVTVGQSESLFVAALGMNEESEQTMKLSIPKDYNNTICDIKVSFTFEDSKGEVYQDQEIIHIPIVEKMELTTSDVRIGKVLADSYSLELDFYNTGKAKISKLMLDLSGEFEATNGKYFVGDLQTGKMDIYSVNIKGEIPEKIKGTVLFSYEDFNGQKIEKKVHFDLTYTKPALTKEETAALEAAALLENKPNYLPLVIGISIGVLILIGLIVKRRAKEGMSK